MRTDPTLAEVLNGKRGLILGIRACQEAQCLMSAVTLVLAAMDATAALARPEDRQETTGEDFRQWVAKYMLPMKSLPCSADDLWGARCGVLHTMNAESTYQRKGKAKRLIFQWREGPEADSDHPLPPDSQVIIFEDLVDAFVAGAKQFLEASLQDDQLRGRIEAHLPELHCYVPWPP